MITVHASNVNEAIRVACHVMKQAGRERDSRNGKVKVCRELFCIEYAKPLQRVLLDAKRDANPFFHLMESLWMLSGSNGLSFVQKFNQNIGDYSDDGVVFSGAYGHRWRMHFGHDQLMWAIDRLRRDPNDRRCVIGMWDPQLDPSVANQDGKDVPCNLSISLHRSDDALDMTVFNRSNDLFWGAFGANVVHFSILQEYLALMIGCKVGVYNQVSSNMHVYERHFELMDYFASRCNESFDDPYSELEVLPLMNAEEAARGGLQGSCARLVHGWGNRNQELEPQFFQSIVFPMRDAHAAFRDKSDPDRFEKAFTFLERMPALNDWTVACRQWLARRQQAAQVPASAPNPAAPLPGQGAGQ